MRYSALSFLVAAVGLQAPVVLGQAPQPPGVTFQVEVNYVDVDVVVDATTGFGDAVHTARTMPSRSSAACNCGIRTIRCSC